MQIINVMTKTQFPKISANANQIFYLRDILTNFKVNGSCVTFHVLKFKKKKKKKLVNLTVNSGNHT